MRILLVDRGGFYLEVSILLRKALFGRMWRFGHRNVSVMLAAGHRS